MRKCVSIAIKPTANSKILAVKIKQVHVATVTTKYIVDTNIVVSALIGGQSQSPTTTILTGMLSAKFGYALSPAMLNEYYAVLNRPRLQKLHGLSPNSVDTLLTEIAQHAIMLNPSASLVSAPDANDQFLWDLLACHPDLVLVMGDKALLAAPYPAPGMASRVITASTFVERFTRS